MEPTYLIVGPKYIIARLKAEIRVAGGFISNEGVRLAQAIGPALVKQTIEEMEEEGYTLCSEDRLTLLGRSWHRR